ncbi:PREDICTED: uncharacterized protein LOC109583129 [Amphimedon queenslandica]|uniref:Interleukin-31 n=1 Tax=Amphimedon queenslandica TaxID=400682 RepID=A0A1X7UI50_AMPQE|nr:PREDICTED: uncharacterized protein LOC109583129 [Amphimedon queenslandica]|eukprot:XP_019853885.1 PREDICTED: uncharacterized protein LOC109583129 [Amphimedon queenslandica]
MASFSRTSLLLAAVAAVALIQCCAAAYTPQQNIFYSSVVSLNLLDELLPSETEASGLKRSMLWNVTRKVIQLHEIQKKINATTSPTESLIGLRNIIAALEDTACKWLSINMEGPFNCTDIESLKTKFDLYDQLKETEKVTNSSC